MKVGILIVLFSSLSMVNCFVTYGQIKVNEDSYKNRTIVTVELKHESIEKKQVVIYKFGNTANITYIKELKNGQPAVFKMLLKVEGSFITAGSKLESDGFIAINGKKISIKLENLDATSTTSSHSKTSSNITGGTSAYTDFTKSDNSVYKDYTKNPSNNDFTTETSSETTHYALGEVTLSTKHLSALENCKELEVRLYTNSAPLTFPVLEKELAILQKFAAAPGAEAK